MTSPLISRVLAAFALVLAVCVSYGWSSDLQPIWDDVFLAGSNPFFKSPWLIGEMFHQWLWIEPYSAYYRPVQNLSFLFDYLIWGTWFPGYRASSLLWHGGAAVMFWRVATGLAGDSGVGAGDKSPSIAGLTMPEALAWMGALIWAVHPAHSAAVAYVSGRADPLAMFFALAGWLFFRTAIMASRPLHRAAAIIAALACGLLALCSRETGLVWLLIFTLYEGAWRSKATARVRLWLWGGALALTLLYAMLRTLPPALFEKSAMPGRDVGTALWKSVLVLGDYATLFVAPIQLSMERRLIPQGGTVGELLPAVVAFVVLLAGMALWPGLTRRLRVFCTIWFLAAFLPISPLLAPPNVDSAEHWMYLPFAGLILGAVALWWDMPQKIRRSTAVVVVSWILFLGVRTHLRARDWRDSDAFMEATLRHGTASPRLLALASTNFVLDGKFADAERIQRKSVEKYPKDPLTRIFLGMVLQEKGDYNAALPLLEMTRVQMLAERATHPRFSLAPAYASACLISMGRIREAEKTLRLGLESWPNGWHIIRNLVSLLAAEQREDEALEIVEAFLKNNPWHLDATLLHAALLSHTHQVQKAAALLEYARLLDVRSPLPDRMLAGIFAERGLWEQSIHYQRRAIRRSGGEARDWRALSALLEKIGDTGGSHAARVRADRAETGGQEKIPEKGVDTPASAP